ncbi:MAG: HAMP domain-containing histidine kinase [Spirochaetes bacterium]|nr:HAMP domain-containing histidine kinase [Spirochaetota bacterium]
MYSEKINSKTHRWWSPLGKINLRIAWLFSFLFICTILTLFSVVFFLVDRTLYNQEVGYLQHKLLGYWALSQTQGTEAFLKSIQTENLFLEGTPFFLRLSDGKNKTLVLLRPEAWRDFFLNVEQTLPQDPEALITLKTATQPYRLIAGGIPITGELFLHIGTSTEVRRRTLLLLIRTFSILLIPLAGISFFVGSFLTSRALAPIQRLTERVQGIILTGDLLERVPPPKGRDELQDLVTLFNTMLDRISLLVHRMRETIDTLAHDLKTPLTRFRGAAELALQTENPVRWKTALEEGIEESEKLLQMMNTILDISAAEAGALPLQMEDVDLGELVKDMVDLYSFLAEEKHVGISLSLPETPLLLRADPNRLRQVVGNLLDNAIKYSFSHTTVYLEVFKEDSQLILRLRDEGEGIAPEDLPHIWKRLYRGQQARKIPGMGLGLSLVKAIVEAHRGTVTATNHPSGKGALFEVRLPALPSE